jgi:glutamate N-acetyltransferase/amino-acid N-acetyltransferase
MINFEEVWLMKKLDGWVTTPQGFVTAAVKAGIKASGNLDVTIIKSTVPAATGAVFTTNKLCAAPVLVSRKVAERETASAIAVNAGCANASTGKRGLEDAREMQRLTAAAIGAQPEDIYVCSTGVIGQFMPMEKLAQGLQDVAKQLDNSAAHGEACAKAIQTTDTYLKHVAYETEIDGKKVTVAGIAKGSGMIHPNMATMLTFITTDAAMDSALLKPLVKEIADQSFNMVVVDGDTSTNDAMIVLANGLAGNKKITTREQAGFKEFYAAFLAVAQDLAKMIADDGEGATKFLEVNVVGAASFADAKLAAMTIAKSPLVKTAFFGKDPNWGRIACAAGYSGAALDPEKLNLDIGTIRLVENGLNKNVDLKLLAPTMAEHAISMTVDLGVGTSKATVWTCDFSYEYVKINGEYHT